jgi:hypothetical protein
METGEGSPASRSMLRSAFGWSVPWHSKQYSLKTSGAAGAGLACAGAALARDDAAAVATGFAAGTGDFADVSDARANTSAAQNSKRFIEIRGRGAERAEEGFDPCGESSV